MTSGRSRTTIFFLALWRCQGGQEYTTTQIIQCLSFFYISWSPLLLSLSPIFIYLTWFYLRHLIITHHTHASFTFTSTYLPLIRIVSSQSVTLVGCVISLEGNLSMLSFSLYFLINLEYANFYITTGNGYWFYNIFWTTFLELFFSSCLKMWYKNIIYNWKFKQPTNVKISQKKYLIHYFFSSYKTSYL